MSQIYAAHLAPSPVDPEQRGENRTQPPFLRKREQTDSSAESVSCFGAPNQRGASLVFRKRKMILTLFRTILRNKLFACGARERPDIQSACRTLFWVRIAGNHQGAPQGECGECGVNRKLKLAKVSPALSNIPHVQHISQLKPEHLQSLNLPRRSREIFSRCVAALSQLPPPQPPDATRLSPTRWPTGSLARGCGTEPVEIRLVLRQGQMGFHRSRYHN